MVSDFASDFENVVDWAAAHRRLWTNPAFLLLGDFHKTIAASSTELRESMVRMPPGDVVRLDTLELTSLGRRIGLDAPGWWVFEEAPDVNRFWNDTKLAFLSAQDLVRGAERFGRILPTVYRGVIDELSSFLDRHVSELNGLARYVQTLASENAFAPAVLYSGAVWGDTRRADRSLEYYSEETAATQTIIAGELAVGVRQRDHISLADAWSDLMEEHADEWEDTDVAMPLDELLRHAHTLIRERLIGYFIGVRDSIRYLDKLCQQYFSQENLHSDSRFLRRLIRKVCTIPPPVETEVWDAKALLNVWHMPANDRELGVVQFAEDVAAFANRRGGILIIGVSDSRSVVGVTDVENRVKHIANMIRTQTDLREDVIRVHALDVEVIAGDIRTCLVIVVGRTIAPVGVRQRNGHFSYPRRVGAGVERVSRDDIAAEKALTTKPAFAFLAELVTWV